MTERNGSRSRGDSPRQRGSNPRTLSLAVIEDRLVRIERKLDRLLGHEDNAPAGVQRLPDGRMFLPGSGVLGSQPLSDEALAALAALDTAAEPDRRQFGADHHPQSTERPLESRLRDEQVVSRGVGAEATIQRLRTQHRGSGPQPDPGGPNRDTPTHDHSQW